MQNVEVDEANKKNRKTKDEIKKDLEESIINGERNEEIETEEKVNNFETRKNAAEIIQQFEQIIKSKKNDIIWVV